MIAPVWPESPASRGADPVSHCHVPGLVGAKRTRHVAPPSQKAGRTMVVPSLWRKVAHASTSRYGFAHAVDAAVSSVSMSCHGW